MCSRSWEGHVSLSPSFFFAVVVVAKNRRRTRRFPLLSQRNVTNIPRLSVIRWLVTSQAVNELDCLNRKRNRKLVLLIQCWFSGRFNAFSVRYLRIWLQHDASWAALKGRRVFFFFFPWLIYPNILYACKPFAVCSWIINCHIDPVYLCPFTSNTMLKCILISYLLHFSYFSISNSFLQICKCAIWPCSSTIHFSMNSTWHNALLGCFFFLPNEWFPSTSGSTITESGKFMEETSDSAKAAR